MGSRKDGAGKRNSGRHVWKATSGLSRSNKRKRAARDAQSWTETVTEGGRRFMTEWRKEEEDKSKSRREKRTAKERENLLSANVTE